MLFAKSLLFAMAAFSATVFAAPAEANVAAPADRRHDCDRDWRERRECDRRWNGHDEEWYRHHCERRDWRDRPRDCGRPRECHGDRDRRPHECRRWD